MLDFARLPLDERIPYFQEVANRRGLTRLIVEKDFWVCFSLRLLFSAPAIADKFVFKGGTSLSKVFGVIKRFSEDIDLSVDRDWLGLGGENRPDGARSRSQFEKRCKKLKDACAAAVDENVRPTLEAAIQQVLGPMPDGGTYLAFRLDEQTHSPVLTFRYPTTEPGRPGYVHPQPRRGSFSHRPCHLLGGGEDRSPELRGPLVCDVQRILVCRMILLRLR